MTKQEFEELQKINLLLRLYEMAEKINPSTPEQVKLLKEAKDRINNHVNKELLKNSHNHPVDLLYIRKDTHSIRSNIELRGEQSIDYSFIPEISVELRRVKKHLIKDNLRMENVCLDVSKANIEIYYEFCTSAFFQVEELLNFYYYHKFSSIDSLITHLQSIPGTTFSPSGKEKNVGDISVATKIFSFTKTFHGIYGYTLTTLRLVRNEGFHRCHVIANDPSNQESLARFLKTRNFYLVRNTLLTLTQIIKSDLSL